VAHFEVFGSEEVLGEIVVVLLVIPFVWSTPRSTILRWRLEELGGGLL
jgi:hypothetical protein